MMKGRVWVCSLVAAVVLCVGVSPARAAEDTTGKVRIETMGVAAGLGYTWGQGVLEYHGQEYPFTVKGFSIVDVACRSASPRASVRAEQAGRTSRARFRWPRSSGAHSAAEPARRR
jgi:hypothetical protein